MSDQGKPDDQFEFVAEAIAKHELNSAQARQLRHRAILTPLQDRVRNFTHSEVWRVYEAAHPDKKKQLEHTLRRKRAELFEKSRGEEVEKRRLSN